MNLSDIQSKLKAPKGQLNKFGGYKYRSCEDIVEAVKPLLAECNGSLIINDEIIAVGERVYVKATATITIKDKEWSSSAYAREPLAKKGMDEAQITGATSSYARKYALNGLLAIDDTKDADTMDNSEIKQGKAGDAIADKINHCKNMNDLAAIWGELTQDQHVKYQGMKDAAKTRISG